MKLIVLILILYPTLIQSEIIEVPNLAMYQFTPKNPVQLHFLNKMRVKDSGLIFINGIGQVDEPVDIIASPQLIDYYNKQMDDVGLLYDRVFHPVTIEMYNNDSTKTASETSTGGPPRKPKFLEIGAIYPPIFSGIFLNIFSSNHPDLDGLSFGSSTMNSSMGNPYLCFSTEKQTKPDGRKQWIFEKSERSEYYVLRNRKLPTGYVTWEDDDEPFLVIETRLEFQRQYKKGGKLRENALFKVSFNAEYPNLGLAFELTVLGTDGEDRNLILDDRFKTLSGCYVLKRGQRNHLDTEKTATHLFKIQRAPGSVRVIAHLENFMFPASTKQLFQKAKADGTIKSLTSRTINNHFNQHLKLDVEDVHERLDKFHLKFNKSLSAFDVVWVPPGLSIGTPVTVLDPRNKQGIHAAIKYDTSKDKEGKEVDTMAKIKYLVTGGVQVPPWSSVEYTVIFGWVNRLELDFNATLRITGKADRMTNSRIPKVVPDQLIDFSMTSSILKERHFDVLNVLMYLPTSPEMDLTYELAVKGTLVAWSIGVKGEIQINVKPLQNKNVTFSCELTE